MRERDTDANGSLDERVYVLQNWRADVIAITDTYGIPLEHIRYDAYGECFNIDPADWTTTGASSGNKGYGVPDGSITSSDINYYVALWNANNAKADVNTTGASQGTANYGWPDGTNNSSADINYYVNQYSAGQSTGRGNLSRTDIDNRLGYAGYTRDVAVNLYHVRNRVYSTELGRWTKRDPLGYVDSNNLYAYGFGSPIDGSDSTGAAWTTSSNGGSGFSKGGNSTFPGPTPNPGDDDDGCLRRIAQRSGFGDATVNAPNQPMLNGFTTTFGQSIAEPPTQIAAVCFYCDPCVRTTLPWLVTGPWTLDSSYPSAPQTTRCNWSRLATQGWFDTGEKWVLGFCVDCFKTGINPGPQTTFTTVRRGTPCIPPP